MLASLMSIRESFDPQQLGPTVLEYLAQSLERGLAARERLDPRRFLDVDYRDFVTAPLETAERIYAAFGLGAPPRDAMRRHVEENPQAKHGAHRYSLEEYGLSPDAVRGRLADYVRRFSI
jgi:hypothetical protein